jgi:hypothetical protein
VIDVRHWGIWSEIMEAGASVGDGSVEYGVVGWATGKSSGE